MKRKKKKQAIFHFKSICTKCWNRILYFKSLKTSLEFEQCLKHLTVHLSAMEYMCMSLWIAALILNTVLQYSHTDILSLGIKILSLGLKMWC